MPAPRAGAVAVWGGRTHPAMAPATSIAAMTAMSA